MTLRSKTKRERLTEREDAIVSAATRAFLKGGLRAARMAEIARAADVAEGTLYLYFRNKEALFAAVVARHWADLTEGASEAVEAETEPGEQLEALARYTIRRILGDWKLFELTFVLAYSASEPADPSDRRGYVKVLDRVIERGIDRGTYNPVCSLRRLRDLFFGTMEYAARSMLARGSPSAADEDEVIKMLMAAMDGPLGRKTPPPGAGLADRLEAAVTRLEQLADAPPER